VEDDPGIIQRLREEIALRKDLEGAIELQKKAQRQLAKDMREAERERQRILSETEGDAKARTEALKEHAVLLEQIHDQMEQQSKDMEKAQEKLKRYEDSIRQLGQAASSLVGEFSQLNTSVAGLAELFIKQAHALDSVGVELAKTTGYASAMHDNMVALADSANGLNLSFSESGKIIGALSLGYKDFNMLNEEAQRSLANTVGRLYRLGVDGAAAAKAMDMLENGLGLTRIAAERTVAEFENLAMATGQPVAQLVDDFNSLAPALARFGDRGREVFNELAKDARRLGLTVQEAFDVTELFDTFQGASDVAGKLNSQLGLQLNSVEIMGASSEDRLKILKAEFDLQGRSFDSMGKRQRQMIAEILQVDVNQAARLFGDPMELRRAQRDQLEQQERLAKFTSAADKLKEAFEQMFVKVEPILTSFTTMVGTLSEYLGGLFTMGNVVVGVITRIAVGAAGGFKALGKMVEVTGKLTGAMKIFGGAMSVIVGIFDYISTGDALYAAMGALGSIGGMMAGAALGTLLLGPGPGTVIGGMVGAFGGSMLGKGILGAAREGEGGFSKYAGGGYQGGYGEESSTQINDGVTQGRVKITGKGVSAVTRPDDIGLIMRKGGPIAEALAGATGKGKVELASNINLILDGKVIQRVSSKQTEKDLNPNGTRPVQSSIAALGYA
jgi:methyl-accepting chemotaxis protein